MSDCEKKGITLSNTKQLPQFNRMEWKELVALERHRLKKKVRLDDGYKKAVEERIKEINRAYKKLI